MSWRFAIINNRLAEIFFEGKNPNPTKIFGHAYVNRAEYTTKKEQKWITADTKKLKFSYRQGAYKPYCPNIQQKDSKNDTATKCYNGKT